MILLEIATKSVKARVKWVYFKEQCNTPFPLQYFVAPCHNKHDDSIESLRYDDLFRHMFGTEIMSRRFTFKSDIRRSVAFTFYRGNTSRHYFYDDMSFTQI